MKKNISALAKRLVQLSFIVALIVCLSPFNSLIANNITVNNITLSSPANGKGVQVHFDLSWENSYRFVDSCGVGNHDAAWVFIKYRVKNSNGTYGPWQHAFLSNTGHVIPSDNGSAYTYSLGLRNPNGAYDSGNNPAMGLFIYRSLDGSGNTNLKDVQLNWNYTQNDRVDIKVFVLEMVYITEGSFYLGSGGTAPEFTDGAWLSGNSIPYRVKSEDAITIEHKAGALWGTGSNSSSAVLESGLTSASIPKGFPKGYTSFYCMKYEVSEQQFRDFLGTLDNAKINEYIGSDGFTKYRNTLTRSSIGTDVPESYIPYSGLTWESLAGYSDWSALRPMTELEFEKAARGPIDAVRNEYAWGDTTITNSQGIVYPNKINETGQNEGNSRYDNDCPDGNCLNGKGPLRVGASATANSNRTKAGAGYYGVMDLTSNAKEWLISATSGRFFNGEHGNGDLSDFPTSWPKATGLNNSKVIGAGHRGGSFETSQANINQLRISDRTEANDQSNDKSVSQSGRAVRTATDPAIAPTLPLILTKKPYNIGTNSATLGAYNISGSFDEKGICWSTKPGPTIKDAIYKEQTPGFSPFETTPSDLISCTHYYVRAYVKSCLGTVYGNQEDFTTVLSGSLGTAKADKSPICKNTSTTVKITGVSESKYTVLRWEKSQDEKSWTTIASFPVAADTILTIKVADLSSYITDYYRAYIQINDCYGYTSTATVTNRPDVGKPVFTPFSSQYPSQNLQNVCQGETYTYFANASYKDSLRYTVEPDTVGTINKETGLMKWSNRVSGSAKIIATAYGCGQDTASYRVTVAPTATAGTASADKDSVCIHSSAVLTLKNSAGSIQWQQTENINAIPINWISANGSNTTTSVYTTENLTKKTYYQAAVSSCSKTHYSNIVTVDIITHAPNVPDFIKDSFVCVNSTVDLSSRAKSLPNSSSATWRSNNTNTATIDAKTGIATGVKKGEVTIWCIVENDCGKDSASMVLYVNKDITAPTLRDTAICIGSTLDLKTLIKPLKGQKYTWASLVTDIATISKDTVIHTLKSGVDTIQCIVENGCGTIKSKFKLTVDSLSAVGGSSGNQAVCKGEKPASMSIASNTGVITWQRSNKEDFNQAANVGTNKRVLTGVEAGVINTKTYFRAMVKSGSCDAVYSATITVDTLPLPAITLPDSLVDLCYLENASQEGSLVYTSASNNPVAYSIDWNKAANDANIPDQDTRPFSFVSTGGSINNIDIPVGADKGLYSGKLRLINSAGCIDSIPIRLKIKILPKMLEITGDSLICKGDTVQLSNATQHVSGTWSSSNATTIEILSNGKAVGKKVGSAIITYSATNGCGTSDTTLVVHVDSILPKMLEITGDSLICKGDTVQLSNATQHVSGTWSSSDVTTVEVLSNGKAVGKKVGSAIITYSAKNGCGTSDTTLVVHVDSILPKMLEITGDSLICKGDTVQLSNATQHVSGTWSSSDVTTVEVLSNGKAVGKKVGSAIITYSAKNGCGTSDTTLVVHVDSILPKMLEITGDSLICKGDTVQLSNATQHVSGTWSSSDVTTVEVLSNGKAVGKKVGSAIITYSAKNGCGTSDTTLVVHVDSILPKMLEITGDSLICKGDTVQLSNATQHVSGTWSSSDVTTVEVLSNGKAVGKKVGSAIITYSAKNGCGTSDTTLVVHVDSILPKMLEITGDSLICKGDTVQLSNATQHVSGTWSSSDVTTVEVLSNGKAVGKKVGSAIITYSAKNGCGTSDTTLVVHVDSILPKMLEITGDSLICKGDTVQLSNATQHVSGTWSSSDVTTVEVLSNGKAVGKKVGSAIITYSAKNGCGTSDTTLVVHVDSILPKMLEITGDSLICKGDTVQLSNATQHVSGTWSSSDVTTVEVLSNGKAVGKKVGSAIITYSAKNGCGTSDTTLVVHVDSILPKMLEITGDSLICKGDTVQLSNATQHVSGTWSSSDVTTVEVLSNGKAVGKKVGSAIITYSAKNGCGTSDTTLVVHVDSILPKMLEITGDSLICKGDTVQLSNATQHVSGTWSSSDVTTVEVLSNGKAVGKKVGSAIITYSAKNGCGTSDTTLVVHVDSILPKMLEITGDSLICKGDTVQLSNATQHVSGTWSSSDVTTVEVLSNGKAVGKKVGSAIITYSAKNGCGTSDTTLVVHVDSILPKMLEITGDSLICKGDTVQLSNATQHVSGTWSSSDVTTVEVLSNGKAVGKKVGSAIITYSAKNGCGTSDTTLVVHVDSILPKMLEITGDSLICKGDTVQLSNATQHVSGTWSSSDVTTVEVLSNGKAVGKKVGSAFITYSAKNGCGTSDTTLVVHVDSILPKMLEITGDSLICKGDTVQLSNATQHVSGTWSSSDVTTVEVLSNGKAVGKKVGSAIITYSAKNGCGTSDTTLVVHVDSILPKMLEITGDSLICKGDTVQLSNATQHVSGTWSSSDVTTVEVLSNGKAVGKKVGSAIITYSAKNGCGTSDTTLVMYVDSVKPVKPALRDTFVCVGRTVDISKQINLVNGVAYKWNSRNTAIATIDQNGVVTSKSEGKILLSCVVKNACGEDSTVIKLTVFALSTVGTTSPDQLICKGTIPADLTITSATGTITWQSSTYSDFRTLNILSSDSLKLTGTEIGKISTTTYFRTGVKSGSCVEQFSTTIKIDTLSSPSTTLPDSLITVCYSETDQLGNLNYSSTRNNPTSYWIRWDENNSNPKLLKQTETTFNSANSGGIITTISIPASTDSGNYTGKLFIKNNNNCIDSIPIRLKVIAATKVTHTAVRKDIPIGGSTSFDVSATGENLSYKWQVKTTLTGNWNNITMGGINPTYEYGRTNDTLKVKSVAASNDNYQYRCKVTGTCGMDSSYADTLKVNGKPAIIVQPHDSVLCVSGSASFTTAMINALSVVWQDSINNVPGWNTITSIGNYNVVTTSDLDSTTLNILNTTGLNGRHYRCIITNASGDTYSNIVTLTVSPQGVGGEISSPQTICYNSMPKGLKVKNYVGEVVKWQKTTDKTFNSLIQNVISANATDTLKPAQIGNLVDTTYFRAAIVSGSGCDTVYSDTVRIAVYPKAVGGKIAAPQTICYNSMPKGLKVKNYVGEVVKWQKTTDKTFNSLIQNVISANATDTLKPAQIGNLVDTTYFRAAIVSGSGCDTVYSDTVRIAVYPKAVGGKIAAPQTICYNSMPKGLKVKNYVGEVVKWQKTTDKTFNSLIQNVISANATDTLKPAQIGNLVDTTYFRAAIVSGSGCDTVYSDTVRIAVYPKAVGGKIAAPQTICYNSMPKGLKVKNYVGEVVKWQKTTDKTFNSLIQNVISANATDTLKPAQIGNLVDTTYFRAAIVSGSGCDTVYSDTVRIAVYPKAVGGKIAAPQTICYNSMPKGLKVKNYVGEVVKWQKTTDKTFNSLIQNVISANATDTLKPAQIGNLVDTTYFRAAIVSGSGCDTVYSDTVRIAVYPKAVGGKIAAPQTICYNSMPKGLKVKNYVGEVVKWQKTTDKTFNSLIQNVISANATDTLKPAQIGNLVDTTYFRAAIVSGSGCDTVYSDTVRIAVYPKAVGGKIAAPQTICYNSMPKGLKVKNYVGEVVKWQKTTDKTFNSLIQNVISANATDTLKPAQIGNLVDTTYFRAAIVSGSGCDTVYSDTVRIAVYPKALGGKIAAPQTICYNSMPKGLKVKNYVGEVVKWQKTTDKTFNSLIQNVISANATDTLKPAQIGNLVDTTYFRAAIVSGSGCDTVYSDTVRIAVYPQAVGGKISSPQTICYGQVPDSLFLKNYVGKVVKWQKTTDKTFKTPFTDIITVNTNDTLISAEIGNLTDTTYFRAAVVSGIGCDTAYSDTVRIAVYPQAVGGKISSPQTICSGQVPDSLLLKNYVGKVVKWQKTTDNTFKTPFTDIITVNTNDTLISAEIGNLTNTTYFRAAVVSGIGCDTVYSDTIKITVVVPPTVSIDVSGPSHLCGAGSVTLTANVTGGGGGYTYKWSPDGETTPSITVVKGGSYSVEVASGGCKVSASENVTIQAMRDASIVAPNSICVGENVPISCKASFVTILDGNWRIVDGSGTIRNVSGNAELTATAPGTITVANDFLDGTCPNSASKTITVNPKPVANFSNPDGCQGQNQTLTALNPISGQSYVWDLDDGSGYSHYGQNVTIKWLTSGDKQVKLKVTNQYGCSDEKTQIIHVVPTPVAIFSYNTPYCKGLSPDPIPDMAGTTPGGTFSSTPVLGLSLMDPATGHINLGSSITPGFYYITYTVTTSPCDPKSFTFIIEIKDNCTPTISYPAGDYCDKDQTTTITPTVTGCSRGGGRYYGTGVDPETGALKISKGGGRVYYTINSSGSCPEIQVYTDVFVKHAPVLEVSIAPEDVATCASPKALVGYKVWNIPNFSPKWRVTFQLIPPANAPLPAPLTRTGAGSYQCTSGICGIELAPGTYKCTVEAIDDSGNPLPGYCPNDASLTVPDALPGLVRPWIHAIDRPDCVTKLAWTRFERLPRGNWEIIGFYTALASGSTPVPFYRSGSGGTFNDHLPPGHYVVRVRALDESWNPIIDCQSDELSFYIGPPMCCPPEVKITCNGDGTSDVRLCIHSPAEDGNCPDWELNYTINGGANTTASVTNSCCYTITGVSAGYVLDYTINGLHYEHRMPDYTDVISTDCSVSGQIKIPECCEMSVTPFCIDNHSYVRVEMIKPDAGYTAFTSWELGYTDPNGSSNLISVAKKYIDIAVPISGNYTFEASNINYNYGQNVTGHCNTILPPITRALDANACTNNCCPLQYHFEKCDATNIYPKLVIESDCIGHGGRGEYSIQQFGQPYRTNTGFTTQIEEYLSPGEYTFNVSFYYEGETDPFCTKYTFRILVPDCSYTDFGSIKPVRSIVIND